MCIPLEARGQLVGVMTIVQPEPNSFTEDDFIFLRSVADQAGVAIHNALLYTSLENLHRQYYELFEDNLTAILITDHEGKINKANRAAYTMLDGIGHELIGYSIVEIFATPQQYLGVGFEKLYSGKPVEYESEIKFTLDRALAVKISVQMMPRDPKGNIEWVISDISAQKQLDTMRHDLLSMIYHDIRSPLANVISSLELLRVILPMEKDPNVEEVFSVISRSSNRIQRLVSNLLDIDRLEMGQTILNARMVDLDVLVDVVSTDVEPVIESRDQHYSINIEDGIEEVWADEDMLRRVLINLLENASKYTPVGGDVKFAIARKDNGYLQFSVSDSGPGIPSEMLNTVFDKFIRVNPTKGPRGIGLGLAFCRLAVEAHNGRIWVESAENKGSSFIFELPNEDEGFLNS